MPLPVFVLISSAVAAATAASTFLPWRQRWHAVLAATAGATTLLLFHGLGYFDYFDEDAFITLRYSRHLADGLGPNWNASGHVEGYTSFLWMAVLGGMAKLGFDLLVAARLLGTLAMLGTFVALHRIWQLWTRDEPESGIAHPFVLVAALLGLAVTGAVAFWTFSGLETPLFTALLTTSAYLYLSERRSGAFPWSALCLVATAMARPEGIIAAGVTGAFVAIDAWRMTDRGRATSRLLVWGALFVIPFGAFFIWRYTYYGYLFPNTFYTKVGLTSAALDRGLLYVIASAYSYQLLPMFAGALFLLARPRLRWDAAYLLVLASTMLLAVIVEGGVFIFGRSTVPLLPIIYLAGFAGFATVLKRMSLETAQNALIITLVLGSTGLLMLRASYNPYIESFRADNDERRAIGTWLNEYTPPDYTIAAFAAGAVGYYAHDRAILDLLGLNDETIAHTDVPNFGTGLAGHEKYNMDYVFDEVRPEIIVLDQPAEGPLTTEEFRARGGTQFSLIQAENIFFNDPRLWERYEVASLRVDELWFTFLQRKDTIGELRGPGLVN